MPCDCVCVWSEAGVCCIRLVLFQDSVLPLAQYLLYCERDTNDVVCNTKRHRSLVASTELMAANPKGSGLWRLAGAQLSWWGRKRTMCSDECEVPKQMRTSWVIVDCEKEPRLWMELPCFQRQARDVEVISKLTGVFLSSKAQVTITTLYPPPSGAERTGVCTFAHLPYLCRQT